MLPNFSTETINDWLVTDRFRFEKEDITKIWVDESTGFTYYKLVFSGAEFGSSIREKIIVFDGDRRVGYICWTTGEELHTLYVMPSFRNKGVAKKLLSYVPSGLRVWVQDFTLTQSEPPELGLSMTQLYAFYERNYQGELR